MHSPTEGSGGGRPHKIAITKGNGMSSDSSNLPPILSETSKLFVASTKATKYKDKLHCLTARDRPKPELVMHRTKPEVFAPFMTQSLNHAQHEQLKEVLHAFENDTTHHCLRPVDRLYWYFGLLGQLASHVSPIQALLRQVHNVLCDAVYDSSHLQHPQATRGKEYAHLAHQVEYDHIDADLEQLQAQLKVEKLLEKAKKSQDKMEVGYAVIEFQWRKPKHTCVQEELAQHADVLRRDEDLYEHLVGDEAALDRKASLHRLQLVEAKSMLESVADKALAMRDGFRDTMCVLHDKEREEKRANEAAQTLQELQRGDTELEVAEADFADITANSADLQRTHTPRPKWECVFKGLPEVAYVDPALQGPPKTADKVRHKKRPPLGRTQVFVKEMCHWLQRIQGDCGMSLQLARLSTLQTQMELLTRRQKKQISAIPGGIGGLPSLVTVAKTVAAATKLLGVATAFPSDSSPLSPSMAPKDFITALGTTPENDVMATLHNFFPMKTPLQLKSIERELLRETKSKDKTVQGTEGEALVAIDDLLPTKLKKSSRGYFVKILRTQHFKEIQDYLALLDRYQSVVMQTMQALLAVSNTKQWPESIVTDPDILSLDVNGEYVVCKICSEMDKAREGSRIVRMNGPYRTAAWDRHKVRNMAHRKPGDPPLPLLPSSGIKRRKKRADGTEADEDAPIAKSISRKKKLKTELNSTLSVDLVGTCPGAIPFDKATLVQRHLRAFQMFYIPSPVFSIHYDDVKKWFQVHSRYCAKELVLNRRPDRGQACEACYQLFTDRQRLMWKRVTNTEGLLATIEALRSTNHSDIDANVISKFLQTKSSLYNTRGLALRKAAKLAVEYIIERRRLIEDIDLLVIPLAHN
ncbi:hypothetical protein DYB37_003511 [Aphanomyces astaci]|uniref:Uncharacterized protein n=2 Tax=Aphanomyces astaci TaxID=112090 RepID=A0A3R7A3B7_APHAT|nr:hypothetical protein DYB35_003813 [Aphanomyces astaci]RHZ33995.1 hypothetical protein DYB37_003511 [Aphanomyces astaci]